MLLNDKVVWNAKLYPLNTAVLSRGTLVYFVRNNQTDNTSYQVSIFSETEMFLFYFRSKILSILVEIDPINSHKYF